MDAVSPVRPGSAAVEVVLGKDQPEYLPLPAVFFDAPECPYVTRWRLSDAEREQGARWADIVLTQLTFRRGFQPVNL